MAAESLMTSPARARELWDTLGGTPFISGAFKPRVLLSLVASVRKKAAPQAHPNLIDYLDPSNAAKIFHDNARCQTDGIESAAMEQAHEEQVASAVERITQGMPEWAPLFAIPIRYRHMPGTHISCTTALIPQTIFLGTPAFASDRLLEETLIHEHAHVWLSFVSELCDLQVDGSLTHFTLPSGTSGKSLRGVLLAGHFAAAAAVFFLRPTADAASRVRGSELTKYLEGCVATAAGHHELSPIGGLVHADLHAAAERLRNAAESAGQGALTS
ncbi:MULTISPECIES: hypothetical protein [Streptomyces]|uniref:hypothetical protein n=1 Tax=Streptomyces TaxID=1883 RepID=UPI0013D9C162|nr:hypothetical protein [Streptomyces salinarius]